MKNKVFFNLNHATRYLVNTVIRLDSTPILITDVKEAANKKGGFIYQYIALGETTVHKTNSHNPKLDMNPVPLGWAAVNEDSEVVSMYLMRVPNRTWHVGYCQANHTYFSPYNMFSIQCSYNQLIPYNSHRLFQSKLLKDTIMGNYRTYEQALMLSEKRKKEAWPFSRRFALLDGNLLYKYFPASVGEIVNGKPVLKDEAFFLKEALQEDMR